LRKSHILSITLGLFLASIPVQGFTQVESTPIPAPNKPNFAPVSFMLGSWTCRTKSARRPAAYVTEVTYALDPTGYWITEVSTTSPTAWISRKLSTWDKITYDNDTKRWADVSYGDGGAYGLSFSRGWNGNQIVWHDVSFAAGPDITSQTDTTTTKVSATKMTSVSSFTEKSGRHVAVSTTCLKS
jgi:hypothetical protein